jgi:uncharacterized protein YkwD
MVKSYRKAFCLLILASAGSLAGCQETGMAPEFDPEVEILVGLVDQHRVSVGCEPATWITQIADVARAHSVDMVSRDFFDHVNPDGETPPDRMRAAGLSHSRAAENIAQGGDAAQVLQGWLARDAHRAVIENCTLTEHGAGVHMGRWTHLFRAP